MRYGDLATPERGCHSSTHQASVYGPSMVLAFTGCFIFFCFPEDFSSRPLPMRGSFPSPSFRPFDCRPSCPSLSAWFCLSRLVALVLSSAWFLPRHLRFVFVVFFRFCFCLLSS